MLGVRIKRLLIQLNKIASYLNILLQAMRGVVCRAFALTEGFTRVA
ncbi:hypothetical protein PSEUDO8BK_80455 [Pseudomonas sp. 8BK]|nr:hypothetical protein PSEUDO8BK_80455 [Pseudomonas sp. 8BK]